MNRRALAVIVAVAASAAAGAAILAAAAPNWATWQPATCMPDHCFCEAIRDGWIRQPANTYSSLAFVAAGALVIRAVVRTTPAMASGYTAVFVTALLTIGYGSAFYHASLSFIGQFIDVMGMYLIATFVVLSALGRARQLQTWVVVAAYVLANAMLAWLLFEYPQLRRYAFAALVLVGLTIEWMGRRRGVDVLDARNLLRAVGLLGAGFVIWVLDITRVLCAPTSLLQGHAAWHVLGAAAAWQLFRYYAHDSAAPGVRPLPHNRD